ncbi:hypothetical protein HRG84_09700 [Flavisolibacter sp. BT320]|nr:hypothetical protein [Flavisolibacter longurius]
MTNESSELRFLKERYASARNKYKPRQVRVLLLAEGPPDSLDRHFYFEDVKRQDSLFLEIMGVLYPEQKKQYLVSGRETELKQELLSLFEEDGYFLLDLADVPCSLLEGGIASQVPEMLKRLPRLIDKKTPIILIKANVYDLCYAPLTESGYRVHPERMPFPGSGQQKVFREKFSKAISLY